jgi:hypothetical protein
MIMKLKNTLVAVGVAALATAAVAWQIGIQPVQKNPLPKHMPGNWTLDAELTKRLEPESRLAKFTNVSFTNDPNILQKYTDASDRLKGMNLILGGMMTIDGNSHPYVVSEKEGCSTLVWFHQGTETKIGDPVAKCVNIILAKEMLNDLLFLGDVDGARTSSVAYKRVGAK